MAGGSAMAMVSIMVMASIANFLIVGRTKGLYVAVAAGMIGVYAAGVGLTGDGWLLRATRVYYEIIPLDAASWKIVAQYGAMAAATLVLAQWTRACLTGVAASLRDRDSARLLRM
jgi:hypothetical protein